PPPRRPRPRRLAIRKNTQTKPTANPMSPQRLPACLRPFSARLIAMVRSTSNREETNMNMDTLSHRGRTGTDDLVPSRYALRIGEIDVLVISDGVFPLPATTLATNADPGDLAAWLDDRFLPPDVFKWPLNVVVVRSGGRTVLIDTGVGAEFAKFPQVGRLAMRLDAAGIDPASVTDVVLTHMHVDHVGGLLADGLGGRLR